MPASSPVRWPSARSWADVAAPANDAEKKTFKEKKTAERAHDRLAKGDKFVAEGYTREYDRTAPDGEVVKSEEFVAKKLGHDLARTSYEVDRTRRQPAVTQETAGQTVDVGARRESRGAAPALGL